MSNKFRNIEEAVRAIGSLRSPDLRLTVQEIDSTMGHLCTELQPVAQRSIRDFRTIGVATWHESLTEAEREVSRIVPQMQTQIRSLNTAINDANNLVARLRVYESEIRQSARNIAGNYRTLTPADEVALACNQVEQRIVQYRETQIALEARVAILSDDAGLTHIWASRGGWPVQHLRQFTAEALELSIQRGAGEYAVEILGRRLSVVVGATGVLGRIIFQAYNAAELVYAVGDIIESLLPNPQLQQVYMQAIRQHAENLGRTFNLQAYLGLSNACADGAVWSRVEIITTRTPAIGDQPPGPWRCSQINDLGMVNNHDARDSNVGPHGGLVIYLPLNEAAVEAEHDATVRGEVRDEPSALDEIIDRPGGVPSPNTDAGNLDATTGRANKIISRHNERDTTAPIFDDKTIPPLDVKHHFSFDPATGKIPNQRVDKVDESTTYLQTSVPDNAQASPETHETADGPNSENRPNELHSTLGVLQVVTPEDHVTATSHGGDHSQPADNLHATAANNPTNNEINNLLNSDPSTSNLIYPLGNSTVTESHESSPDAGNTTLRPSAETIFTGNTSGENNPHESGLVPLFQHDPSVGDDLPDLDDANSQVSASPGSIRNNNVIDPGHYNLSRLLSNDPAQDSADVTIATVGEEQAVISPAIRSQPHASQPTPGNLEVVTTADEATAASRGDYYMSADSLRQATGNGTERSSGQNNISQSRNVTDPNQNSLSYLISHDPSQHEGSEPIQTNPIRPSLEVVTAADQAGARSGGGQYVSADVLQCRTSNPVPVRTLVPEDSEPDDLRSRHPESDQPNSRFFEHQPQDWRHDPQYAPHNNWNPFPYGYDPNQADPNNTDNNLSADELQMQAALLRLAADLRASDSATEQFQPYEQPEYHQIAGIDNTQTSHLDIDRDNDRTFEPHQSDADMTISLAETEDDGSLGIDLTDPGQNSFSDLVSFDPSQDADMTISMDEANSGADMTITLEEAGRGADMSFSSQETEQEYYPPPEPDSDTD